VTDDQRAILARRFQEPLSKAAPSTAGAKGGRGNAKRLDDVDQTLSTNTRTEVAKQFNVPERKVREAAFVAANAPELAEPLLRRRKATRGRILAGCDRLGGQREICSDNQLSFHHGDGWRLSEIRFLRFSGCAQAGRTQA
jgi:hypothetical protein